ncbi:survival motor neuron protein-like [Liolophura sinensis]|uniref:survival motor neuron protein-like n=1 Tax=Liolophura sinensis TaxID=3198878 RepID=UPI003158CCBC
MSEVWCKGDNCLAPWSNDGKLYQGLVRKIVRRQDGQVCAKVRYHGFGPEEEEVEISRLQKSPILHIGSKPQRLTDSELNSGIFRPLTGIEEDKRIRSPAPRGNSARETVSKKTDNAQTSSSMGKC